VQPDQTIFIAFVYARKTAGCGISKIQIDIGSIHEQVAKMNGNFNQIWMHKK
jgi:hypothetical protein